MEPQPDNQPPQARPTSNAKVRSALRERPLGPAVEAKAPRARQLREGALETLLNGAGLLKDALEDFQNSDRFFKYKALVLGCWLALTVTTFGVACPGTGASNPIKAELVVAGESASPVFMIKNNSEEGWNGVRVIVNGRWFTTADTVAAGRELTLSNRLMSNELGEHPPTDLRVAEIIVETDDGKAELLREGKPR